MRTLRQTIEGMPLVFDPTAATGLSATIQFEVNGAEAGRYHLHIVDGQCRFHKGTASSPTLKITTSSAVWQQISAGEISGRDALTKGLYQADGDLGLLLKMNNLFRSKDHVTSEAAHQQPAGPLPLRGMQWIHVGFLPWIIFWITFDFSSVSYWISVGVPFLLTGLTVGYRETFNASTWLERGGLVFFAVAGVLTALGSGWFAQWGSTAGSLLMGTLWLATLPVTGTPLTADYSKWKYIEAMWTNSTFLFINAAITLMWGGTFVVSALIGMAAVWLPSSYSMLTVLRHGLLVPAMAFTLRFQREADQRRIERIDQKIEQLRLGAWAGLAVALGALCLLIIAA